MLLARKQGRVKVIVINVTEASVVRRIFKMYVDGTTFTAIAKRLTAEGIPTKNVGKTVNLHKNGQVVGTKTFVGVWSPKLIRLMLSNPVYIGKVRYGIGRKDYYIGDGHHEPIIDEELFNKVQDKLSKIEKKVRTNRPKDDVYFCGTLVCGVCGNKLTTSRTMRKKDGKTKLFNSYRCINQEKQICNARYISHKKAEEAFIEYLTNNVSEFDCIDDLEVPEDSSELIEIKSIKKQLVQKRTKQKEVMNLFMASSLSYDKFKYMSDELDKVIKEYEAKLKELEDKVATNPRIDKIEISKYIVDHWKLLTNKEKLEFLNQFVESITIVNRSLERRNGKAEVLEVMFFEYKQ